MKPMSETAEQRFCRVTGWDCPCHALPNPPWPSGKRPALRCPVCDHPDLAVADMGKWWAAKLRGEG